VCGGPIGRGEASGQLCAAAHVFVPAADMQYFVLHVMPPGQTLAAAKLSATSSVARRTKFAGATLCVANKLGGAEY